MARFTRRGHYRTNVYGTTYWVREHDVGRDEYRLTRIGDSIFVNGSKVIPNVKCKICSQPTFFYKNEYGSKVYFDELGPPWPKHECYHGSADDGDPAKGVRYSKISGLIRRSDIKAKSRARKEAIERSTLMRKRRKRRAQKKADDGPKMDLVNRRKEKKASTTQAWIQRLRDSNEDTDN